MDFSNTFSENPYNVLGVPEGADENQVKKAYRKLALQHHPDRVSDPSKIEEANKRFSSIAHAYEILTDETLRNQYHRFVKDNNINSSSTNISESKSSTNKNSYTSSPTDLSTNVNRNSAKNNTANNSGGGSAGKGGSGRGGGGFVDNSPKVFTYQFSDPYEIWKRDFKDQFGFEYPGAAYDFVSYDTETVQPDLEEAAKNRAALLEKNGIVDDGKFVPKTDFGNVSSPSNKKKTKKGGFTLNPFRKKDTSSSTDALVPYDGQQPNTSSNSSKTKSSSEENQLTVRNNETQLGEYTGSVSDSTVNNNGDPNSSRNADNNANNNASALVVSQGRNNRPIAMDVVTKKEGKVTTTITTITRPDGTTETMVMRTGLPKKKEDDKPKHLQLTDGAEQQKKTPSSEVLQLTNGGGEDSSLKQPKPLQLTNGNSSTASTTNSTKKAYTNPLLTNGSNNSGNNKNSVPKNTTDLPQLTNGEKGTAGNGTKKKGFKNLLLTNS